jgi:hypothetical protein
MTGFPTCPMARSYLLANEFLDALPIHQFERAATGWSERQVGLREGQPAHRASPHRSPCPRSIIGSPTLSPARSLSYAPPCHRLPEKSASV